VKQSEDIHCLGYAVQANVYLECILKIWECIQDKRWGKKIVFIEILHIISCFAHVLGHVYYFSLKGVEY
jgi:hypothetical protein